MTVSHAHPEEITVLVVDDEELVRMCAIDTLHEAGFRVLDAPTGPDALALIEKNPDIRVVFSDVNMPGAFDGAELVRKVHALRPDIRLILTSGRVAPPDHDLADIQFIPKPYHPWAVSDVVRAAVGA